MNVPRAIAVVVGARLASMTELSTTLGSKDLYDLVEILVVDAHNERVANAAARG